MKRILLLLLLAASAAVLAMTPITLRFGDITATYFEEHLILFDSIQEYDEAVVWSIVDGDTITLKRGITPDALEKVRLIGVDTPESVHPEKSVEHFAIEASNFAKAILEDENVLLSYDWNPTDTYGRLLAYVWLPAEYEGETYNILFNLLLISSGYGHAYTRYVFDENYMGIFIEAERLARLGRFGLWKEEKPDSILLPEYDPIVYITSTGDKYHIESCRFLENSKIPIVLSEAARRGYIPCRVCKPPELKLPSISVVEEDFITAITEEGSDVILYPDGTWEYAEPSEGSQ
ncbi:thermonuclease family protein [Mesotoga sp. UBA5825]|uniref:thermonuclease family protein n=1 Tax=Mesotoga sp. UBA5825 TaxID=1946858 RepID=UPI0025D4BD6C|nr:thermonuclease family protein [Mesotoga sp. UBA5825]